MQLIKIESCGLQQKHQLIVYPWRWHWGHDIRCFCVHYRWKINRSLCMEALARTLL